MNSFISYFKKEVMEGIRNYKFLILALGFIIFALLDPLMLKLLPNILESQAPGLDLSQLTNYNQVGAIQNYMSNLFQIGNLVLVLTLMGLLSEEIKNKTLIIPYSNKANITGIVLAKYVVYSIAIMIITFIAFSINYYYSKLLFPDETISILRVSRSIIILSIYFLFNLSLILFTSSLFKKGILAGIFSLSIIYLIPTIGIIENAVKFTPYYLVKQSSILIGDYSDFLINSILLTIIYMIILILLTIYRIHKVELK
ncbi:ABC transporter permease [Senegalia massiliensis]|uniref:ABC transporter permease n=1 Tax=Senegalia massiliensis TaxID=1720316 RepID=UPI00102F2FCD|nr:ABC transporter permease [Senegalia massiliensis]